MVASLKTWVWAEGRWNELRVDVAATPGFSFHMVGTRDPTVREAPNRIHAALLEVGAKWPGKRITVSFHPTRPWQLGSAMDLPIALAVLMASGQVPLREGLWALGTLDLKASLSWVEPDRPAPPQESGLFLYPSQAPWRVQDQNWAPLSSLREALEVVKSGIPLEAPLVPILNRPAPSWPGLYLSGTALTALGLAAAGRHPTLLIGAPGVGKSEFARAVHSLRAAVEPNLPFVEPSSTLSPVQLVGANGAFWAAGTGVLFMDELGEMSLRTLEVLRKPMEAQWSRDAAQVPQTIGATNPCPCGYHGHQSIECTCGSARLSRYQERFSGPFLDRFQMGLILGHEADSVAVPWDEMVFKLRMAQERQRARGPWAGNSGIPLESLIQCAEITREAMEVLNGWHKKSGLGLRALHHAMRLARTAADWGQRAKVSEQDAWLSISLHASQFRLTSKSGPWGLARSSST